MYSIFSLFGIIIKYHFLIYCIYLLHTVLVVPPLAVISPLDLPHCLVDGRSVPAVFSAPGITMQSNPFVLLAKIKPCFYGASLYNTRLQLIIWQPLLYQLVIIVPVVPYPQHPFFLPVTPPAAAPAQTRRVNTLRDQYLITLYYLITELKTFIKFT